MNNKIKIKYKTNRGAAMMILVLFFVFISTAILSGLTLPVIREFRIASNNLKSKQSYFLSESGIEDAIYRIKNNMKISGTENLVLGDSSSVTTVTDLGGGQKQISSLGNTYSKQRKVDITLTTSTGTSFHYGLQAGVGGVYLSSGKINGNVYSNGPIIGDSSSSITGTAISADSPSLNADQSNGSGVPQYNITFARISSSNQDIAQSFKVSKLGRLNKVSFYIKKVGNPNGAVVKIMNDYNGNPGSNILAQGSFSSSSVTNSYGWIDVSFSDNPTLDINKTYWLVIDSNYSYWRYYVIGASKNNYLNGVAKIGRLNNSWSFWNPWSLWNNWDNLGYWNYTNPPNLDYYFGIYLGGFDGLIEGSSGSIWNPLQVGTISGEAQAHTVNYTNATGKIYCQSGVGNNKDCSSQPDPTYIASPISEANITEWKNDALSGGTYQGNYYVGWFGSTLGPKKINGNLYVRNGGTLVITGTLWVTGKIKLYGGGKIKLASSYGSNDGIIITDGTVYISSGGSATGSGTNGSYLMILSTNNSSEAIEVSGGAGAMIVVAPNGGIKITGGASLKEATGYKISVTGGSSITYEAGLANNNFSSGPSGSWKINSWKEVK